MKIFLSYSRADGTTAERIAIGLRAEGHVVFFDRTDLPAGESYDAQTRTAVESCDLLIFLVSPDSVEKGRYTRTELSHASRRWKNPAGRVLPVMVRPTPYPDLPAYLNTVTVLEPSGNIPADVAAAVSRLQKNSRGALGQKLAIAGGIGIVLALAAALAFWSSSKPEPEEGNNGDPQQRERSYLVEWFRDLDPNECADIAVSKPNGIVIAREQNNGFFRLGSCNLFIDVAALELIGDVRFTAFNDAPSNHSGSAAAGSARPVAEGFDDNHNGIDGRSGRTGGRGSNGAAGENAGVLELHVDEWRGTGTLFVDFRGQNGEQGQNGGRGGKGQQGATGEKAKSGIVSCKRGSGTGGDGGTGGAGGAGGDGGGGGGGGLIFLSPVAEQAVVTGKLGIDVSGGQGGNAGNGGACGVPGDAGRRGLGSTLCQVQAAPWRWGNPGEGCLGRGKNGSPGGEGQAGAIKQTSN